MLIQPNSTLLMVGDSVTDCEHSRSDDLGLFDSLGSGYVSLVNGMLMARFTSQGIKVINRGIGGNTVRDLKARWEEDVLNLHPDWLSVCIGINDVWRQFDSPEHPEWGVPLQEYSQTLLELVRVTQSALKGLVLLSPYYIQPDRADPMRRRMDEYGTAVQEIADSLGVLFVDTQAGFDLVLEHHPAEALAWDRIHPTLAGHMLLAQLFLKGVKFDW